MLPRRLLKLERIRGRILESMELCVETARSGVERSKALSRGVSRSGEAILLQRPIYRCVFLKRLERIGWPAQCVGHVELRDIEGS